jgi:hypothetical protein
MAFVSLEGCFRNIFQHHYDLIIPNHKSSSEKYYESYISFSSPSITGIGNLSIIIFLLRAI